MKLYRVRLSLDGGPFDDIDEDLELADALALVKELRLKYRGRRFEVVHEEMNNDYHNGPKNRFSG